MRLFSRKSNIDYNYLISKLERGDSNEIREMLWQPKDKIIEYLPITIELIRKLRNDNSASGSLTIHKQRYKGRFELIIFKTPGSIDKIHFSPLLIDKDTFKIVGIMLLFNELHGQFTKNENNEILKLSTIWIKLMTKNTM